MSGTYRGIYKVQNREKYLGDPTNVCYRSAWELKFMKYCDATPGILAWNSEEVIIPYISPKDGQYHKYHVDFWIRVKDKDGNIKEKLIEIKPYKKAVPPQKGRRRTKRFHLEAFEFQINMAKWHAAEEFAERNDLEFIVLTEKGYWHKPKKSATPKFTYSKTNIF